MSLICLFCRMPENMEVKHGTSEEDMNPYCDPCFEGKGLKVKVCGYCKDCFQFLCFDCHTFHEKSHVSKGHAIVQGSSMPKDQNDKLPMFHKCDNHPATIKDQFCCIHKIMICSLCSFDHKNCIIRSIEDVCKYISSSETDSLFDAVKSIRDQVRSTMLSVETNIKKIKEQKQSMLRDANQFYHKIISNINKLFLDMQSEIEANCQSQILLMSQQQEKINAILAKLESSMIDIEKFQGKRIDTKLFLRLQEHVSGINRTNGKFTSLNQTLPFLDLSFIPSKMQEFLPHSSVPLGTVSKAYIQRDTSIMSRDIVFPCDNQTPKGGVVESPQQSGDNVRGATRLKAIPVSQIKGAKQCEYNVKMEEDTETCYINGMTVTEDGRILMVDHINRTIKLFTLTMNFLSSILVSDHPWDIVVTSDRGAVATTNNESLVLLQISGNQLHSKGTTKVPYDVRGIAKHKDKLIVSSDSPTSSVKLIDLTGKVYWSVSSDQRGQSLFSHPWYLTSNDEGRPSTVIVTDWDNDTLTMLNGETGEITNKRQLQKKKGPTGITTDTSSNVYVCYFMRDEVSVLSDDLSVEKILLSTEDGLRGKPQSIIYNDKIQQLLISYQDKDIVDSFKLS